VLGNFLSILESWRGKGCRAELFYPAHDPVMDEYGHGDRPIDVLFVGGYSRTIAAAPSSRSQDWLTPVGLCMVLMLRG
jgi:hypothetical protein